MLRGEEKDGVAADELLPVRRGGLAHVCTAREGTGEAGQQEIVEGGVGETEVEEIEGIFDVAGDVQEDLRGQVEEVHIEFRAVKQR